MKVLAIIITILNSFIWFIAGIGSLSNLSKGIIPAPTKPSLALVVFMFILFLMNLVVLSYLFRKTEEAVNPRKEVNMKKLFIGIGWFFIIYVVGSFLIGMVIGAIAGSSTLTPSAGAEAGKTASINFFHKYGLIVFLGSLLAAIVGTSKEWLPFTSDE